ncbi:zinc-binding dehydrogenase [Gryllotalpicola reticulitermitis]|uniref:Zinc-binding dehydrogenase n=1 Tax=Gryllotalpicola reticulitermitis TaxID=1184153 RepID=A0ABV8Q376_9MICO
MRAAVAVAQSMEDPLAGLSLEEVATPQAQPGWTRIRVRAASLNPHDIWTLRGVGHPAERIPMVLGCDGAGVTDAGDDVVIHPVLGDPNRGGGDVTFDPRRALLTETVNGALAEYVLVPDSCVVPKPEWLSFEDAATLGIVWGTAYRMLFTRARLRAGDRVLVQGASGGVGSAAISLARAAGARVFATARTQAKRDFALAVGAHEVFESGARLPERVDVVVDTVGEATWGHSLRSLQPGGTIVTCGATTGNMPPAELNRIFFQQLSVVGSTGSTRSEFEALIRFLGAAGIRPHIDSVLPFDEVRSGFQRLIDGDVRGKLVVSAPDAPR